MVGIAAVAFVAIFFFGAPFPLIVIAAGIVGFVGAKLGRAEFAGGGHGGQDDRLWPTICSATTCRAHAAELCAAPDHGRSLAARCGSCRSGSPGLAWPNVFSEIAVFFSKMAMVTFGGAYAGACRMWRSRRSSTIAG